MPKISVIVPTYNRGRFIGEAIESVLAQTYKDHEIIVVDDGSTDDTHQRLEPFLSKIRVVFQDRQERCFARNRGVAESSGEYLAFLDSDDLLLPNKLALQAGELDSHSEIGLVASGYEVIDENDNLVRKVRPWEGYPDITLESVLFCGFTQPNAVLLRREWFERIGGFDPRYQGPEDMDFWYRLCLEGCVMEWVREIVCQYRLHSSNSTNNVKKHYSEFYKVIEDLFKERALPSQIFQRKPEILARLKMQEACQLYLIQDFECAKARFREAITLLPSFAANDYSTLFQLIVDWQKSFRVRDPDRFVDDVISNLPISLTLVQLRRLYGLIRKSRFFDAYSEHSYYKIPGLWVEIVRFDLSWLLNRGGWSILVRSIIALARQRITVRNGFWVFIE